MLRFGNTPSIIKHARGTFWLSIVLFKISHHLFKPISLILAQCLNGWASTQLTIVLLKMDQIGSLEARICSPAEVLCGM